MAVADNQVNRTRAKGYDPLFCHKRILYPEGSIVRRVERTWVLASIMALAGLLYQAQPVAAQDRLGIVIGNGAYADTSLAKPAGNGISVSRSLLGLGFDVIRLEDANAVDQPLEAQAADTIVLYFSGRTTIVKGKTLLLSVDQDSADEPVGWALTEMVSAYHQAGAERVLVFLDVCHAELSAEENLPTTTLDMPDVFYAQVGAPNTVCPTADDLAPSFTDTLLSALLTPNVTLSEAFGSDNSIWSTSTLAQPYIFRQADESIKGLAAEDLEMLDQLSDDDRERMLALWRAAGIIEDDIPSDTKSPAQFTVAVVQNETIVLSAPIQPINIAAPIALTANIISASNITVARGGVQIFTAVATPARRSRPNVAGLPAPSIIVGDIRPTNASFDPTDIGGALSGTEVGSVGFDARRKIRADDSDLFEQLLTSGAFDPLPEALPSTIQTELARMGCYTTRVDGIWGNGSRAAVDRYFQQIGRAPATREPVTELFRQLVRKDDVTCPVVRSAVRTTTPQRSTTRTATAPRRTAPAAQPVVPAAPRTINRSINAAGVFR